MVRLHSPLTACLSLALLIPTIASLPLDQKTLGLFSYDGSENAADSVIHELRKAEIIPTVVTDFVPSFTLDVGWSDDENASLGNTLKPEKLQDAPSVKLEPIAGGSSDLLSSNLTYTVTLTDPDAPSRDDPRWSEMCHWITTGLPGRYSSLLLDTDSHSLEDIVSYKPPGPPKKTGKHRYVFLVFAPRNGTTEKLNLTKPDDRKHWGTGSERHGVRDWAAENQLVPVAANFIYAQNKKQ